MIVHSSPQVTPLAPICSSCPFCRARTPAWAWDSAFLQGKLSLVQVMIAFDIKTKKSKSNLSPFKYQAQNKHTFVESSLTSVSIVLRSIQPQFNMFKNKQEWIHKIKDLGYSRAYSWVYSNESNLFQNSNWWTSKKSPKLKVICISTHAQPWHCSSIKLWMS